MTSMSTTPISATIRIPTLARMYGATLVAIARPGRRIQVARARPTLADAGPLHQHAEEGKGPGEQSIPG